MCLFKLPSPNEGQVSPSVCVTLDVRQNNHNSRPTNLVYPEVQPHKTVQNCYSEPIETVLGTQLSHQEVEGMVVSLQMTNDKLKLKSVFW